MRKLHRTALFAGMLAIGVAACGDDVTISDPPTPPPPPLSVTLTPSNQTVSVGEVADFVASISGGAEGASVSITCASSNTTVASVSSTETGCRVTGLEQGSATITATVTKGNQSASAGGQLIVTAEGGEPATVSISSVTKGGLTQPVDQDNVFGQIDVTLNVTPNDQTVTRVEVLVDGEVAAAQEITAAFLEEQLALHEDEDIAEQVQQITLSFNTARYDVDEDALTATPRYLNGNRQIQARIFVAETPAEPAASNVLTLRFNNADAFHVLADTEGNQALSAEGLLWIGGPEFSIAVSPVPVMYSARTVTRISLQIRRLQAATPAATERCTAAPVTRQLDAGDSLTFEFTCAGAESDLMVPFITSVADGNPGPSTGQDTDGNFFGVANLTASDDHPFPARIDVRAPVKADAEVHAFRIVRQSGLENVGNWLNSSYAFASGFNATNVVDEGVGRTSAGVSFAVSTDTLATFIAGPTAGLTGALFAEEVGDGAESVTNQRYIAWAVVADRLENARNFRQEVNEPFHALRTFGYDDTAPQFTFSEGDDVPGQLDEQYNIINQFGASDRVEVRATDILSGFFQETAANHALIGIRGQFNGEGAITTNGVVVAADGTISAEPFAAARDGEPIATLASVGTTFLSFIDQTAFQVRIDDFGSVIADPRTQAPARYYLYQLQMRDRAGNIARGYRAVYLNNNSQPVIENLTNPSVFDGNATFMAGLVRDSVEVLEGSLEIRYPNTGGTLVWERPTSELSSILRMNADILDGELFNDVIYRPQTNVAFPLGLADLGVPFIKSIQTVNASAMPTAADSATAQPDSVRARVFNGFGANQDGLNHSSAAGSGVSALVSRALLSEELPAPSFFFHNHVDGAWTFSVVERDAPGVENCSTEFCVRAIGPLSTFTNPFDGGPVFIVWSDDGVTGFGTEQQWRVLTVAQPNFSDPFPTRDSGADRIYEWTFNTSGLEVGTQVGDIQFAAVGVHAGTGDALLSSVGFPEPAFNVRFDPAADDVVRDGPATVFDLLEGTNSTGEGIATVTCDWVDASGNTLLAAPAGLTLTDGASSCSVTATGGADLGETHRIRATATGNDGGGPAEAFAEVTVIDPPFEIDLGADQTEEIPATGGANVIVDFPVTSASTLSALSCSIAPASTGVSVAVNAGTQACDVTVTDAASAGDYTVTANATEDGTGRTASDSAVLTLEAVSIVLDPVSTEADPTEIAWSGDTDIFVLVQGSSFRDESDIDLGLGSLTECTITPSAGMDATFQLVGGEPACTVSVIDPTVVTEGDEFEIDFTIEFTDGRVDTATGFAFLGERPVFAPVLDIQTAPDNRREIERDRTANFIVIDGEGLGIDDVASVAVVSPSGSLVTADVIADVDGTIILQVAVAATADTGNYTVTVTFEEVFSGDTDTQDVFIRVIDTGTGEVDGGQ